MKVTLRPLSESDALTSYRWRNDAEVWKFTGSRPTTVVTVELELEWIRKVLARPDERRFAICVGDQQTYVGNVQLTHITSRDAELHLFLGERTVHGQGVGTEATRMLLEHARSLGLEQVYLSVHRENVSAIRAYEKCGFELSADDGPRLTFLRKLSA
jgi:RimJ/RimL family protein N-acetyltransferase